MLTTERRDELTAVATRTLTAALHAHSCGCSEQPRNCPHQQGTQVWLSNPQVLGTVVDAVYPLIVGDHRDPLTELPTRPAWLSAAEPLIYDPRAAVVFIDLDHFKDVNDGFGHEAGDAVLKESAQRLRACAGPRDVIGRIGGDEFIAAVRPDSAEQLAAQLMALHGVLHEPIRWNGAVLPCGASIGACRLATLPQPTLSGAQRGADLAMYRCKEAGPHAAPVLFPEGDDPYDAEKYPAHHGRRVGRPGTGNIRLAGAA